MDNETADDGSVEFQVIANATVFSPFFIIEK